MKAKELIKILEKSPDAEVAYEDMNFGGWDSAFTEQDVKYCDANDRFYIVSTWWENID